MRSFLYVFATGTYIVLLGSTAIPIIIGGSHYLNLGFPPEAVAFGMEVAVYNALMAAVPLIIRWKLKGVKWGTLGVYTLILGVALCLQATRQDLLSREGAAMVLMVLAIGSAGLSVYCFHRKVQFVKAMRDSGRR